MDAKACAQRLEVVNEYVDVERCPRREVCRSQYATLVHSDDPEVLSQAVALSGHEVPAALTGTTMDVKQRRRRQITSIIDDQLRPLTENSRCPDMSYQLRLQTRLTNLLCRDSLGLPRPSVDRQRRPGGLRNVHPAWARKRIH